MNEVKLVFSTITGEVYTVGADEVKNLEDTQVVLKKPFPKSCRKCQGRGYIGFFCENKDKKMVKTDSLVFCLPCIRKCVNKD